MAVTPAVAKTHAPAHGTPGADNGKKLGWSKEQKPAESNGQEVRSHGEAPKPRPNHSTPTQGATPPMNSHAKAGKTTICHSTGSETNPYVEITISNNALKAHARHHDGRDIIPAPAEGCESGAAQGVDEQTESDNVEGGVLGRRRTNRVSDDVKTADKKRKGDAADGGVLGAAETNVAPENASQPVAEEDDDGGSLPFTGFALGAVLLMAVVAVAAGAALRRASRAELD